MLADRRKVQQISQVSPHASVNLMMLTDSKPSDESHLRRQDELLRIRVWLAPTSFVCQFEFERGRVRGESASAVDSKYKT